VTEVAVPVTIEVAYDMAVGDGPRRHFHLSWVTTVAMVPTGARRVLRVTSWALDARGAEVTVRHDDPPGPVVVRSSPPGSGP
jgi:hypothetical protein